MKKAKAQPSGKGAPSGGKKAAPATSAAAGPANSDVQKALSKAGPGKQKAEPSVLAAFAAATPKEEKDKVGSDEAVSKKAKQAGPEGKKGKGKKGKKGKGKGKGKGKSAAKASGPGKSAATASGPGKSATQGPVAGKPAVSAGKSAGNAPTTEPVKVTDGKKPVQTEGPSGHTDGPDHEGVLPPLWGTAEGQLFSHDLGGHDPTNTEVTYGQGGIGFMSWEDEEGNTHYGLNQELTAIHAEGEYGDFEFEGDLGVIEGGATVTEEDGGINAEFGGGVTVIQGEGTWSTGPDKDSNHDTEATAGGGVGVGLSAAFHATDEDGDGIYEIGFGADVKFLKFDFKSEVFQVAAQETGEWIADTAQDVGEWVGGLFD